MKPRLIPPLLLVLCGLYGCQSGTYDIDRMSDPVMKARFSCQYLLERALAAAHQKDPDGVLRRRVADFAEPAVVRRGDSVDVSWSAGSITRRSDGSRHDGSCSVTLGQQGRFVSALILDGRPLHAGFGM